MRRLALLPLLPLIASLAAAEDAPAPPKDAVAPGPVKAADADGWRWNGKLGAFFSSVGSGNAENSNDPAIGGTTDTIAYQLLADESVGWRRGKSSVDQTLVAKYGRQKQQGADWAESVDQIDYNGIYAYTWKKPHFVYGAWGADTQITEPSPGNGIFEPGQYKVSAGYGQRYEDLWVPEHDKLEARIGVRAQRRWGSILPAAEKHWEFGPEFVARYERKVSAALRYWLQYEAFDEFDDLGHVSNLITAAVDIQLSKYISASFGARAYYEALPDDADPALRSHYGSWSWRQEALIGLTWQH